MTTKNWVGIESLEARFGAMTVGLFLKAFRESDELSQVDFARKLKISRANLCDLEKDRKLVSPERAAKFARILKVPETALVRLALQDLLRAAHLNYRVEIKGAS
jgi:transcriptional regulator with XRE-family HTH domain